MSKRLIRVDASALVQSSCNLRAKRIILDGYKEKLVYNDTLYGTAFHRFISTMYESAGDIGKATLIAQDIFNRPCQIRSNKKHLTEVHLLKTCFDYWDYFKKHSNADVFVFNGRAAVEIDFDVKLYEDDYCIINGTGTADKLEQIKNGVACIGDYKTNSLYSLNKNPDIAIQDYFKQYELSTQLRFYHYMFNRMAAENPDTEFAKIFSGPVGTVIEGVFIDSKKPTIFARSDVRLYKPEEVQMFERNLMTKVKQIAALSRLENYSDMDGLVVGACNDGKFPCRFHKVCAAPGDIAREFLLKNEYAKVDYNPLTFSK